MSDQEWANGPANGGGDSAPAEAAWEGGARRSASPAGRDGGDRERERERERSRSPMRGVERGRGPDPGQNNPGNNLHVSGISSRCEDDDLRELFAKYGTIAKCQVMKDPHTQEVRGFGFVNFEKSGDAEAAIDALNGTNFLGKTLTVQKARRGRARTPTPGQYHGPPKERGYGPPPRGYYDYPPRRDDRYGGGYGGYGGYRDERPSYRDYDRYDRRDERGGGRYDDYPPPRGGDYRRDPYYDDRRRY